MRCAPRHTGYYCPHDRTFAPTDTRSPLQYITGMPAVYILNVIRKGEHVAMRPYAAINVATCSYCPHYGY